MIKLTRAGGLGRWSPIDVGDSDSTSLWLPFRFCGNENVASLGRNVIQFTSKLFTLQNS